MVDGAFLLGVSLSGLAQWLERYRVTSHGANAWTLEGLINVVRLMPHFERVLEVTGGTLTSGYRSERVNRLVGGVAASDHLAGRAIDLVTPQPLDEAAERLFKLAQAGELGSVKQIIREPSWLHIGWYDAAAKGAVTMVHHG